MTTGFCTEQNGSLILTLHIQPRAPRTEIIGLHGGALKIKVNAPPVEGAANEEVIRFFSELLGVKQIQVRIKLGLQSRHKVIEIFGTSRETLAEVLPAELREELFK